jgi:hypothetical protein
MCARDSAKKSLRKCVWERIYYLLAAASKIAENHLKEIFDTAYATHFARNE